MHVVYASVTVSRPLRAARAMNFAGLEPDGPLVRGVQFRRICPPRSPLFGLTFRILHQARTEGLTPACHWQDRCWSTRSPGGRGPAARTSPPAGSLWTVTHRSPSGSAWKSISSCRAAWPSKRKRSSFVAVTRRSRCDSSISSRAPRSRCERTAAPKGFVSLTHFRQGLRTSGRDMDELRLRLDDSLNQLTATAATRPRATGIAHRRRGAGAPANRISDGLIGHAVAVANEHGNGPWGRREPSRLKMTFNIEPLLGSSKTVF